MDQDFWQTFEAIKIQLSKPNPVVVVVVIVLVDVVVFVDLVFVVVVVFVVADPMIAKSVLRSF